MLLVFMNPISISPAWSLKKQGTCCLYFSSVQSHETQSIFMIIQFVGIEFLGFIKKIALIELNWFDLNWFSIRSSLYSLKLVCLGSVGFLGPNQTGLWTTLIIGLSFQSYEYVIILNEGRPLLSIHPTIKGQPRLTLRACPDFF
jgi:hypothetical protein